MDAMQPALRVYLTKLREESYVDIQPGFVDSGASAKRVETGVYGLCAAAGGEEDQKTAKGQGALRPGRWAVIRRWRLLKEVVAGPDTTGGRTLTGADAQVKIDPTTGLAVIAAPTRGEDRQATAAVAPRWRKVKREKIRFGQPPRNTLPARVSDDSPVVTTRDGQSRDAGSGWSGGRGRCGVTGEPGSGWRFGCSGGDECCGRGCESAGRAGPIPGEDALCEHARSGSEAEESAGGFGKAGGKGQGGSAAPETTQEKEGVHGAGRSAGFERGHHRRRRSRRR